MRNPFPNWSQATDHLDFPLERIPVKGKRDDVGTQRVTLRPYTRVNVSGEYTLGRVVLSGVLENAFNDQSQEITGFRSLGRMVLVGGRVYFGRESRLDTRRRPPDLPL